MTKRTMKAFAISSVALALSACSSYSEMSQDELEYRKESSLSLLEESKNAKTHSLFREVDKTYLGKLTYGTNAKPRPLQLSSILYYFESTPMEIPVALNRIGIDHGINIILEDDAKTVLGISKSGAGVDTATTGSDQNGELLTGSSPSDQGLQLANSLKELTDTTKKLVSQNDSAQGITPNPSDTTVTEGDLNQSITLNASNITLSEWLDDFTMERGLFWDYGSIGGRNYIEITATVSETLQFEGMINSVEEGGVSSGANIAWSELKDFATDTKSDVGEVSTSDSTGRLYIRDTPSVISKIRDRVEHENDLFTTEILYDLRVVTFRQSENENIQFNWSSIYTSLTNTLSISTPGTAGAGFGGSFVVTDPTSSFQGSSATANALKTLLKGGREAGAVGRARNRTSFKSAPSLTASIVSGTTVTQTDNGNTVSEVITSVNSGIKFDVVGSILSGGKISVDLSLTYEDEISRETRSGPNGDISLPTVYRVPITPQFILQPGATAIYATTSSNVSSSRSGVHEDLGWFNLLFGGGSTTTSEDTLTLIILSAKIIGE